MRLSGFVFRSGQCQADSPTVRDISNKHLCGSSADECKKTHDMPPGGVSPWRNSIARFVLRDGWTCVADLRLRGSCEGWVTASYQEAQSLFEEASDGPAHPPNPRPAPC